MPDPAVPRVCIATRDPNQYTETFVRRHIAHLNGGATAVIALRGGKGALDKPVLRCAPAKWLPPAKRWRSPFRAALNPVFRPLRDRQIIEFLKQHRSRQLLSEFGYIAIEVGAAARKAGVAHYCYLRGNDASARLADPHYVTALAATLDGAAGVLGVSQALLDNLACHGIIPTRTLVAPSGTDTHAFRPAAKKNGMVLCVGRFARKKRPDLTIRVFAQGAASRPDARLHMVGDGRLEAECRQLAASLGVADKVHFHGRLPVEQVQALMAEASIYLQHFQTAPDGGTEGMPSVLQEAMASGCTIVTTCHSGIPEHVTDGVTGLLSPESSVDEMASNLGRALEDKALRTSLGAAARKHAETELDYRILFERVERFMGIRA